jgi:hypothetical protein
MRKAREDSYLTEKNQYPITSYQKENPLFIAVWDEEIGAKIDQFYPKVSIVDIEDLAYQIFIAYQSFWDIPNKKFKSRTFILPVKKLNKKAKILFESIPDSASWGGSLPFIVVLLVPDFLSEPQLKRMDDLLVKISQDYIKVRESPEKKSVPLKKHYQKIKNRLRLIENQKEKEADVSEFYSYTAAVEDFEAAVNLFKKKKYSGAYKLLRKVLVKFKKEKHDRLVMEVMYLLGSIYAQQKKYKNAQEYFQKLYELATRFEHDRFRELSLFMDAFCYYKKQLYDEALHRLHDLEAYRIEHINKLQYLTIYAKTLKYSLQYKAAEQKLLKALELIENVKINNHKKEKQRAHLFYELGIIKYRSIFQNTNNINVYNKNSFTEQLEDALGPLKKSSEILEELEEWEILTTIYSYISNIYEILDKKEGALKYLYNAMEAAKKGNKILKLLNILLKIIRTQADRDKYKSNTKLLKDFLSKHKENRVLDLFTKGVLYKKWGNSLILSGEKERGLNKLLKAHSIFKGLSNPIYEDLEVLKDIRNLYEKIGNIAKVVEVSEQIKEHSKRLEDIKETPKAKIYPLGELKEIWIFSNESGLLIYSYTPETGIDHDLIGGFLTALKELSIQVTQQELNSITIGKDRYTIYGEQGYNFFILGRSNIKSSPKTISKILKIIYKRFWKEYSNELKSFSGSIDIFNNFTDIINSFDFTLIH